MSILGVMEATAARYQTREAERQGTLAHIQAGEILQIAANTPDLVAQRLRRLGAATLEEVLEAGDLRSPRFFEQGLGAARAVGRLRVRGEQGEDLGAGTAFLVSPRLLLTTHHLLPSPAHANRSWVEFDAEESTSEEEPSSVVVALAPAELFLCDADLDYTLVAVAPEPGLAACGWLPLIADPAKLLVGERVSIIQHANGAPKRLAIRQNLVVDALETFLVYQSDSAPATSGAPVFNDQWDVVALHHSGVAKRNGQGEVLSRDGAPWQDSLGEQGIAWVAQEGVRVSALVRHIRDQDLAPEADVLRQELLAAAPPPAGSTDAIEPVPGEVWLAEEEEASPPPLAGPPQALAMSPALSGTTTWTIPLRVSLSFGAPVLEGAGAPAELAGAGTGEESGATRERWALFGSRPPSSAPPPAAPAGSSADFRLAALARTSFDWQTSLSLCLASELAYSPAAKVKAQARAWGFSDCAFVEKGAAQGFLAWTSELAMVAFRGTESTADWLSNLHLTTRSLPGVGQVHAGFLEQFQALRPALESLLIGRSSLPLLVTGHSLGGAIAVVAASSWAATRPVRALYTYGQPAVAADNSTATAINTALAGRYHRLVNDADIVPRVPPGYRHGGHLLRFDSRGRVTSQEPPPTSRPGATRSAGEPAVPSALAGEPMLTAEEFQALQGQLRSAATTRGASGTRGLISDHMLPGYLSRIRQQIR